VWSYDFVYDRTRDGRGFRMLTILDEYSRECLAIDVGRKITHDAVMHRLTDLFFRRGIPEHIRSDNGSEFSGKSSTQLAESYWCENTVHRARESMGEWEY
jgi:transposase InsO family protein